MCVFVKRSFQLITVAKSSRLYWKHSGKVAKCHSSLPSCQHSGDVASVRFIKIRWIFLLCCCSPWEAPKVQQFTNAGKGKNAHVHVKRSLAPRWKGIINLLIVLVSLSWDTCLLANLPRLFIICLMRSYQTGQKKGTCSDLLGPQMPKIPDNSSGMITAKDSAPEGWRQKPKRREAKTPNTKEINIFYKCRGI